MATLKIIDIKRSLSKKGFSSTESDHTFYHLWVDGKKTSIWTKYSHGEKEIGDPLINQMAAQTKLKRDQFMGLIQCSLSGTEYVDILRTQGYIKM